MEPPATTIKYLWNRLCLLSIAALPASVSAVQHYEAKIESVKWNVTTSPVQCKLKQGIPGFGEAIFQHSAGGELSFVIRISLP